MVKLKRNIKFNKKSLNALQSNANSGVELQKVQHHLGLHPIHLHDINKSIKDCLNEEIGTYNKKFGGIVLGYQNVKLLSDKGHIINDSCFIHIDLLVEFFVFKPAVDKNLRGIVNRKSKSHIGVLVYDTFNVSIPIPKDDEDWLGHSVKIGQEVLFSILYMNMLSHLPYIEGTLLSIVSNTKESSFQKLKGTKKLFSDEDEVLISTTDEVPIKKSKKKKKSKEKEGLQEILPVYHVKSEVDSDDNPTEKILKKKKRKKTNGNPLTDFDQSDEVVNKNLLDDIKFELDPDVNPTKKKRKKRSGDSFTDFNQSDVVENKGTLEDIKSELDSDNMIEKKIKNKKRRKQSEVLLTSFDPSNNETMDNIKFELASDDNITEKIVHKKRKNSGGDSFQDFDLSDRIENNENVIKKKSKKSKGNIDQENQQMNVTGKQSKKRKKVKDEEL